MCGTQPALSCILSLLAELRPAPRYHIFYQNLPDSADWSFGMCWGHAVSQDLVHWTHLPPALKPSPGKSDADGCFTGSCMAVDGVPTILYTGALRSVRAALRLGQHPSAGDARTQPVPLRLKEVRQTPGDRAHCDRDCS